MSTRDMQGLLLGSWRKGCAVGCGLLVVVIVGGLLGCSAIWLGVSMVGGKAKPALQPPPVVVPVAIDQGAGSYAIGNNASVTDSNRATAPGATVTDARLLAYTPYAPDPDWANSTGSKAGYLAWANATGAQRTPYTRGQVLTYGNGLQMTVTTADFDYSLLKDAQGNEWACPAIVNDLEALAACQPWQRGKW